MTPRERRKFTKKFKLEVVRAYLQRKPRETQIDIAARYDIGKSAMSNWLALYESEAERSLSRAAPAEPAAAASERRLFQSKPAPAPAPAPAPPAARPPAADQQRTLFALANVVEAIEPLHPQQRRIVVEAVLRLLPP